MSEQLADGAVVSGIGISRIGRKTGVPGVELTVESAQAAIADAGLDPSAIDGIATLGDTPVSVAAERLKLSPGWVGPGGFGRYGLLTPVVDACEAVMSDRGTTSWSTAPSTCLAVRPARMPQPVRERCHLPCAT